MRALTATIAIAVYALCAPPVVAAQTAADSAAIRSAALDYIEGYFTGDAERMARALHPELAKRVQTVDPETGRSWFRNMGASELIEGTRAGFGRRIPEGERRADVTILDIFQNAASVRIDAGLWVDYQHLVSLGGRWVIANVLWEARRQPVSP